MKTQLTTPIMREQTASVVAAIQQFQYAYGIMAEAIRMRFPSDDPDMLNSKYEPLRQTVAGYMLDALEADAR